MEKKFIILVFDKGSVVRIPLFEFARTEKEAEAKAERIMRLSKGER